MRKKKFKNIRKVSHVWILPFLFCLLVGCTQSATVQLKEESIEFEQRDIDVCQMISKINDTEVQYFNVSDHKIVEGDDTIVCPQYKITSLGKQEVPLTINGKEVLVSFEVKDSTPPEIKVSNDYKVEEGNPYFDLKKMVSVIDAFDAQPIIGYTGEVNLQKAGIYKIVITATDENKNKTSKNVDVTVTEKEVIIKEKEVAVNIPNETPTPQPEQGSSYPTTNPPVISIPATLPSKQFLFADGYNMTTGFEVCKSYRGSANGSCSPLRDASGLPYGYEYQP